MQPRYQVFAAGNVALRAGQAMRDSAQPNNEAKSEAIEAECIRFAEGFTENQMCAERFFEYAEAFGSEALADFLAEDDQHALLQLVLKAATTDDLKPFAKPVIARLYSAAYNHREEQLNEDHP